MKYTKELVSMYVYDWLKLIAGSSYAEDLRIDLSEKTLLLKTTPVVERGGLARSSVSLPDGSFTELSGMIGFDGDPYAEIERLYAQYKRSVPGKRERLNKGNFKAFSSDQLSYEELETNMSRREARVLLEGFVLLAAASSLIPWRNPSHFFWQGTDPDLVLYRAWIMNTEEDSK